MGEYARYYTLERFGVDIGDDDDCQPKPKKDRKWACKICGKRLSSEVANRNHLRDKHAVKAEEQK